MNNNSHMTSTLNSKSNTLKTNRSTNSLNSKTSK